MKHKAAYILVILCFISYQASALDAALKKQYPYSVLTEDYGILNQTDLNSVLDGVYPPIDLPKKSYAYIYWQCFPRQHVTISLEDIGYPSENHKESDAEITIIAYSSKGITHKYEMRRNWVLKSAEYQFNQYAKLMQAEKYVCLAGTFIENEEQVVRGQKQRVCYWVFEKMKTKKGCEAYFENGCHNNSKTI